MRPLNIRCAYSQGSTNDEGRKTAPDMCRRAVLASFKERIEKCHINNAADCPLKRFYPIVEEDAKLIQVRP